MTSDQYSPIVSELDRYHQQMESIRADERLSDDGRREALSEAYENTRKKVSELHADERAAAETREGQLRRELFGATGVQTDTTALAQRDAAAKVSQAKTPTDLARIMQDAHEHGDRTLERAGAEYAYRKSQERAGGARWVPVLQAYGDENPGAGDRVAELLDLGQVDTATRLLGSILTSVKKPAELSRTVSTKPKRMADDLAPGGSHFFR